MTTARFADALVRASEWHRAQLRKKAGRNVPYISHLLATAALVLEDGGDEDQAIAGLLHDAIEDQGVSADTIGALYGPEVARIVVACTDTATHPKPPWLQRKIDHIEHLRDADEAVLRVTAADKLHNCRDIVADVREEGPEGLERFNGRRQGTCWYYAEMTALLDRGLPLSRLTTQLGVECRALHALAGVPYPASMPA